MTREEVEYIRYIAGEGKALKAKLRVNYGTHMEEVVQYFPIEFTEDISRIVSVEEVPYQEYLDNEGPKTLGILINQ